MTLLPCDPWASTKKKRVGSGLPEAGQGAGSRRVSPPVFVTSKTTEVSAQTCPERVSARSAAVSRNSVFYAHFREIRFVERCQTEQSPTFPFCALSAQSRPPVMVLLSLALPLPCSMPGLGLSSRPVACTGSARPHPRRRGGQSRAFREKGIFDPSLKDLGKAQRQCPSWARSRRSP